VGFTNTHIRKLLDRLNPPVIPSISKRQKLSLFEFIQLTVPLSVGLVILTNGTGVSVGKGISVGAGAAVPKSAGFYIRSMAVHPDARGQGIARQLLQEIENFAAHHRHRRLFLSTTPFLKDAIRLYERFGFQQSDEGPHDLFGTPLFTMVKLLFTTDFDALDG